MGIFPELTETRIFPNNPSVEKHIDFIDEYFAEETEAGRMSGPFTVEELEGILGGPFQCSPLAVDEKELDGSFELKLRMCINLSKGDAKTPSTNSFSDKEDFPTNYDPAALVGDLVSQSYLIFRPQSLQFLSHFARTPRYPHHSYPFGYLAISSCPPFLVHASAFNLIHLSFGFGTHRAWCLCTALGAPGFDTLGLGALVLRLVRRVWYP